MKFNVFLNTMFIFLVTGANSYGKPNNAKLDLKNWNVKKKSILTIDCKWEFYWNKFLTPVDFKRDTTLTPDLILKPSSWDDVKLDKKSIGNKGFATYRLTLTNLPQTDLLLDAYSIQTAYRIYLNDKLMVEVGKPGKTKELTQPANRDVQVSIPQNANAIELIVHVANFHHRKGGFVHPFEIGTFEAMSKQRMLFYNLDFIESSALAILGLFLLALFIFRRKDFSILYFSLFCITLCFRPVISVNYLLGALFPEMNWSVMIKMEYLSVMFPCLFMLLFIRELFPQQLHKMFVKVLGLILIIKITVVLFFPPVIFSWLILPLLFIIPLGVLVFAMTIIKAVWAKVEGANYAGLGIIVLMCSLMLKVMAYSSIISPVYVLITVMDIAFIFMMSLILGSRFSLQFVRVEALQKETQMQAHEIERKKELVEKKNKEILDSIQYAKRIQQALLPSEKYIERNLKKKL